MLGWLLKQKKQEEVIQPTKIEYNFNQEEAKYLLAKIKERFGLDYSKQEFITMNKIESFAKQHNCTSFADLEKNLQDDPALFEELINLLTVNETYFFRELQQIQYLTQLMKQENLSSILSAPCASGEEVYTILIHLKELGYRISKMVGIDINTQALQKAKEGIYSLRSVSRVEQNLLTKYFYKVDDKHYKIDNTLRLEASFMYQNVFENIQTLGQFDVVFSRNMLIYFNQEDKQKAIAQFYKLLKTGGYLFLGHADIVTVPQGFQKVHRTLQIYKKV